MSTFSSCGEKKPRDQGADEAARRQRREKEEVTDDSRRENVSVCGNILLDVGITRQQSERTESGEKGS